MVIKTEKELEFYILADMMLNCRTFKYTFRQRFQHLFEPDYIIQYLRAMRKCSYFSHQLQNSNSSLSLGGGINSF